MNKIEAKEDLIYMLDEIDKNHICLYYSVKKKDVLDYIDLLLNKYPCENYLDFKFIADILIKKLCGRMDHHTGLAFSEENTLPFEFRMFNDSLYVVDTISNYNYLLYSKLIRINGVPTTEIMSEIDKTNTFNTLGWRNRLIVNKFTIEKLLSLPSIKSTSGYLNFEFDDLGITRTLQISIKDKTLNKFKDMNFGFEGLENLSWKVENKAFIIKYFRCNKTRNEFEELTKKIDEELKNNNVNKVILDLRNNTGGSSEPIKVLTSYLVKRDLDSYTLVDGGTFSSGMIDAYYMRYYADSKIIGEEIGESITNFGGLSDKVILPHSKLVLRSANKYFYLDENNKLSFVTSLNGYKKLPDEFKQVKYIPLDREITVTLNDVKNGIDPIMKYALTHDIK